MRRRFGWGLPPGVSNHMIEEQAGAFEEEEMAPYWQGVETEEAMEKLVEEIAEELADYYVAEDGIGLAFVIPHGQHWPLLRRIVARIGKAYADGELELPGEVGREPLIGWNGGMVTTGNLEIEVEVGDILIALRKEEDMPKELKNEITKGQRP